MKCIGCNKKPPRNKRADLCQECFEHYTEGGERVEQKAV